MAMTPTIFSISALAVELARDRRTVAKALANVPPDGRVGPGPGWRIVTAIEALADGAEAGGSLKEEQLALTRARRRIAEGQAKQIETTVQIEAGKLGYIADFQQAHTASLTGVRAGCLALPSRIAQRLPHLSLADIRTIDDEIRAVLTELADAVDIGDGEAAA